MRPNVFLYGEVLIRYDLPTTATAQLFPVGSGLNVAATLTALTLRPVYLLTALSLTRESQIVKDFCQQNRISLRYAQNAPGFLGSYHLYRPPTLFHWQVVYNRTHTPWTAVMAENHPFAAAWAACKADDYFYFDGISLLTHPRGWEHLEAITHDLTARQILICFDFNLRATLAARSEQMRRRLLTLLQRVDYLSIGLNDARWLLKTPRLSLNHLATALAAALPRLKAFWGYTKTLSAFNLTITPYYGVRGQVEVAAPLSFGPREQIGLGDAFSGYMLAQLVLGKPANLVAASQWVMLKSQYYGDATVPHGAELASMMKGEGVIR